MQNEMKNFFDKFLDTNRMIFEEMKKTITEEQQSMISNMDSLKKGVGRIIDSTD